MARRFSLAVVFVLCVLACSVCAQPRPGPSFALPDANAKVMDFAISSSGQAILFVTAGGDSRQRRYAIFTPATGTVREVVTSTPGQIAAAPQGNLFAMALESASGSELLVIDTDGALAGVQRHPHRLWDPQFSSDGREVLLRANAIGAAQKGSDVEFTAAASYGVFDQKFQVFAVMPPGLALRRGLGNAGIMVFPIADVKGGGARVYDSSGNISSQRPMVRGLNLSATGVYYISPQLDPRAAFTLYDAAQHKQLREFNRAGARPGEVITALRWHPRNDKWLAVWRENSDSSRSLEIFDVDGNKTVRSVYKWDPAQGNLPWAWAPDGSAIVIFHSGKFWFEPVK